MLQLEKIFRQSCYVDYGEVGSHCPLLRTHFLTFLGIFGAAPLAIVGAVFSDMFDARTRGMAITVFSMTVFSGPLLAPFIGGFIVDSYLGWRWTEW